MTRRAVAILLLAALAAGCVEQPMGESALELATERMGATAVQLHPVEARRVAANAQQLRREHSRDADDTDEVVWTSKKPAATTATGGLVRDSGQDSGGAARAAETSGPAPRTSTRRSRDTTSQQRPAPSVDDASTVSREDDGDRAPTNRRSPAPKPPPSTSAAFVPIADVVDPDDDASGESPRYADIRQLLIESDGKRARVTVAVAGAIPTSLGRGEVQGVGIDFYRTDDKESDYQLFADGGSDGWRAFLSTPDGVVEYPGTFGIGGRVFVFEVPWSTLGGKQAADVAMFVDWSRRGEPLNEAGDDRAPARGRVAVDPQ